MPHTRTSQKQVSGCQILVLPLERSLGRNPSVLQDFCASAATWKSLGIIEAAVGTEHISAARGAGTVHTQAAPSIPVVPNTKHNQRLWEPQKE